MVKERKTDIKENIKSIDHHDIEVQTKITNLLHLANKSGNLSKGFSSVKTSILKKKTKLVIFANDLSFNTQKKILCLLDIHHFYLLFFRNKIFFEHEFNSTNLGLISIDDTNFSLGILKYLKLAKHLEVNSR